MCIIIPYAKFTYHKKSAHKRCTMVAVKSLSLLILLFHAVHSETLYLSVSGTNTNSCTQNDPCGNLVDLLSVFSSSNDTTSLTIRAGAGTYGGTKNTNIEMPNVPVVIEPTSITSFELPKFSCNGDVPLFITENDFSMEKIIIASCGVGILSKGGNIEIRNSRFSSLKSCIECNSQNTNNFYISTSNFTNCDVGINFSSNETSNTDTININLHNLFFSSVGPISFYFNEDLPNLIHGSIEDCVFSGGSQEESAIRLENGAWRLTNIVVYQYKFGAKVYGEGENTVYQFTNFTVEQSGIGIYANGSFNILVGYSYFKDCSGGNVFYYTNLTEIIDTIYVSVNNPLIGRNNKYMNIVGCIFQETLLYSLIFNDLEYTDDNLSLIKETSFLDNYGGLRIISTATWIFDKVNFENTFDDPIPTSFIEVELGNFTFVNCNFNNTNASSYGGAIFSTRSGVTVENCVFDNCISQYSGGAICFFNETRASISNSVFSNCEAAVVGGAVASILPESSNIYLTNVTFQSNTARTGAAVSCCDGGVKCDTKAEISSVTLNDNVNLNPDGTDIACVVIQNKK